MLICLRQVASAVAGDGGEEEAVADGAPLVADGGEGADDGGEGAAYDGVATSDCDEDVDVETGSGSESFDADVAAGVEETGYKLDETDFAGIIPGFSNLQIDLPGTLEKWWPGKPWSDLVARSRAKKHGDAPEFLSDPSQAARGQSLACLPYHCVMCREHLNHAC